MGPVGELAWVADAIRAGGGTVVGVDESPDALVWTTKGESDALQRAVKSAAGTLRWIQLCQSGIEGYVLTGIVVDRWVWSCAKGAFAEPVAEHALMLALSCLRQIKVRARATSWGSPAAETLFDQDVTVVGGGGICRVLTELLTPFRARVTVVRRQAEEVPGAARTLPVEGLHEALAGAAVVFLALPHTRESSGLFSGPEFRAMDGRAVLVNVGRGPVVDTHALERALRDGEIAAAGLDVTDPEPLPDSSPLWDAPNCLITPHTADTVEMVRPLVQARITANVQRYAAGQPLLGLVDPEAGY
jgi:phosphoglycerate dehydrogenase-like enzyme